MRSTIRSPIIHWRHADKRSSRVHHRSSFERASPGLQWFRQHAPRCAIRDRTYRLPRSDVTNAGRRPATANLTTGHMRLRFMTLLRRVRPSLINAAPLFSDDHREPTISADGNLLAFISTLNPGRLCNGMVIRNVFLHSPRIVSKGRTRRSVPGLCHFR